MPNSSPRPVGGVREVSPGSFVARLRVKTSPKAHLGTFPSKPAAERALSAAQKALSRPVRKRHSNNKTGQTGVSYDHDRKRFVAFIYCSRKRINLGRFLTFDGAKEARIDAELKHFKQRISE